MVQGSPILPRVGPIEPKVCREENVGCSVDYFGGDCGQVKVCRVDNGAVANCAMFECSNSPGVG